MVDPFEIQRPTIGAIPDTHSGDTVAFSDSGAGSDGSIFEFEIQDSAVAAIDVPSGDAVDFNPQPDPPGADIDDETKSAIAKALEGGGGGDDGGDGDREPRRRSGHDRTGAAGEVTVDGSRRGPLQPVRGARGAISERRA